MGRAKPGWWIAGACAVVLLMSVGYGMGRRSVQNSLEGSTSIELAGAPLISSIQIEPIQPQEELEAISVTQNLPKPVEFEQKSIASAAAAVQTPARSKGKMVRVREIQQALTAAGFDPGPADGRMGARTRSAIRDFQRASSLQVDGKVGRKTWAKLGSYLEGETANE